MIELVIVYCLAGEPVSCVERRDPLTDWEDPVQCMTDAELRAQQYVAEHPKYHLARWRCEMGKPREEDL